MSLHDDHDQYLALFIQQNRTDLQWLLDFKRRDFASASANLYAESQKEKKVPRKQIMLSIAKLAYFAGQPGNGELGAQRASEGIGND